jgi:hypothetical protein
MSDMQRLAYVNTVRLPTEKAHGYQICKMCEAFASTNLEVILLHPFRYQVDRQLQSQNVFDYYGLSQIFTVRTLQNFDVIRLERFVPKKAFILIFFVNTRLWELYAALVARAEGADLYYTRNIWIAYWLMKCGLPTVYISASAQTLMQTRCDVIKLHTTIISRFRYAVKQDHDVTSWRRSYFI